MLNGDASHPPIVGHMRVDGQFQISIECGGMRRATAVPLTDSDIAQLALAAAVRNVGMTQLLSEVVATAIKKGLIEEILREPSPALLRRRCRKAPNRVGAQAYWAGPSLDVATALRARTLEQVRGNQSTRCSPDSGCPYSRATGRSALFRLHPSPSPL